MYTHYYFGNFIMNYLLQFSHIFNGLQVKTGKDATGTEELLRVPVRYGSVDRVVASIKARNTQNTPISIPMMSVYMTGLNLAPERRKGMNNQHNTVVLEEGGVFPTDLKVLTRITPIPYNMEVELAIYASNTYELYQILEQILIVFDPMVQIQTNDKPYDWTKLTWVELVGINNEENYPMGGDKRILQWTLNFSMPIWLNPPVDIRNNIVRDINITLGDLDNMSLDSFDDEGNLVPFAPEHVYANINVTGS